MAWWDETEEERRRRPPADHSLAIVLTEDFPKDNRAAQVALSKFLALAGCLYERVVVLGPTTRLEDSGGPSWLRTIPVRRSDRGVANPLRRLAVWLAMQREICRHIRALDARAAQAFIWNGSSLLLPALYLRRRRTPTIYFHIGDPWRTVQKQKGRASGFFLVGFVRLNVFLQKLAASRIGVEHIVMTATLPSLRRWKRKAVEISLYVDAERFRSRRTWPERDIDLLYLGRFSFEKGIDKLLAALPLLGGQTPPPRMRMIGSGTLGDRVEAAARTYGFLEVGRWLDQQDLPALLTRAKILILASETEGLPNVVLEAAAAGTLVLAPAVGAIPGVIRDGFNGWLLASNRPADIAAGVARARADRNGPQMSLQAEAVIRDGYTFPAALRKIRIVLAHRL